MDIFELFTPLEQIREYYKNPAISQSTLKAGLEDFKNYYTPLEPIISDSITIGSLTDIILTHEFPKDSINELYEVIYSEDTLSPIEKTITSELLGVAKSTYPDTYKDKTLESLSNSFQLSPSFSDWQKNWKLETKTKKIVEKCSEYFDILKLEKEMVSADLYNKAVTMADFIKREFDRFIELNIKRFAKESESNVDDINTYILYQVPLYHKITNPGYEVDVKGLLDAVVILECGKTIKVFVVDFKTIGASKDIIEDFKYSFRRYRYDIQGAFYHELIKANIGNLWRSLGRDFDAVEFISLPKPSFIVGSEICSMSFMMSDDQTQMAYDGSPAIYTELGYVPPMKGIKDALAEYNYYVLHSNGLSKEYNTAKLENSIIEIDNMLSFHS